ncbi:DUF3955 domain-containing protein [Lysobacter enzymogenes]|jgi:hypothetical protein|uniref:DUF3955 domain-containing protein n=1 Tax=Lysobacter enzymogenes TaxID=69 RepID=UPI00089C0693|nr:DUF3955 domain-containing protein [Lysobacter enzymogenes]SDW68782.1 Protein of unknown function [Lysobacter enzymogenes]
MSRFASLPGLSALCFALAAVCALAYHAIGAQIDADGFLREPFGLIPIGWLFAVSGALLAIAAGARAWRQRRRARRS